MGSPIDPRKHSATITDLNKADVSVIDISDSNGKLEENVRPAHLSTVFDRLTRCLQKGVLKQELSGIQETTFFGVNNFRNI